MHCEGPRAKPRATAERLIRRWKIIKELYDEDEYVTEVAEESLQLMRDLMTPEAVEAVSGEQAMAEEAGEIWPPLRETLRDAEPRTKEE